MPSLDIAQQRLHAQHLTGAPLATPEAVVGWFGAVQSQDYAGAKWAIAQRTGGATGAALDQLFASGAILRTHVLRPTWHFVLPADIRWMLELTAPRVHAATAYYYRQHELDDAIFDRSETLLAAALDGGNHLTRTELAGILQRGGIEASGPRLGHIMMHAELEGVICSGPRRGKQFTYALLDERAPNARRLDPETALAELTRRYLTSHGPATVHDFAWWSGLSVSHAKTGIELVKSDLTHETIDGATYWFAPPTTTVGATSPIVHLLPNYDEFLVAFKAHAPSFDPTLYARIDRQPDALLAHIVVIDGLVSGGWRRTISRTGVNVELTLLRDLTSAEATALQAAATRYGEFLELPVTVI